MRTIRLHDSAIAAIAEHPHGTNPQILGYLAMWGARLGIDDSVDLSASTTDFPIEIYASYESGFLMSAFRRRSKDGVLQPWEIHS